VVVFYPCFTLGAEQKSIVPSEQTSLGFGVAAAIGAKAAKPIVRSLRWWATVRSTSAAPTIHVGRLRPARHLRRAQQPGFRWLEYQCESTASRTTVRARSSFTTIARASSTARGEHLRFSQPIYYSAGAQHAGADRDRRRARDQPAARPRLEDFEST